MPDIYQAVSPMMKGDRWVCFHISHSMKHPVPAVKLIHSRTVVIGACKEHLDELIEDATFRPFVTKAPKSI